MGIVAPVGDEEIMNWIRVTRTHGVGPAVCFELLRLFGNIQSVMVYAEDLARRRSLAMLSYKDAKRELERVREYGADIIAISDHRYPKLLRRIHSAPPLLTVLGDVGVLSNRSIAIVGSRGASINGKEFARSLARRLGDNGWNIVSGMARGIDAAAQEAAAASGFSTVAVLGSGIDVIYPEENRGLYKNIVSSGGAVVSEFAFGEGVKADNFPRRNRIISGLSRAVVVIEAGKQSGSLITARFALEQGREVFAVPGSPLDSRSAGTNKLIKDGASLLTSVDDVLENMYMLRTDDDQDDSLLGSPDDDGIGVGVSREDVERIKEEMLSRISHSGTKAELIFEEFGGGPMISLALIELELEGRVYRNFYNNVYVLAHVEESA